jgi:hypothetical protein
MPRPFDPRKGKRQRFYARNALNTTLEPDTSQTCTGQIWAPGRLMRLFWGTRADPYYPNAQSRIYSALTDFADECCGTLARLVVYVGALALLAIGGIHIWDELPAGDPDTSAKANWSTATRSYPAFAVSQPELVGKTASYEILRHPEGGRKDILRWTAAGEKPVVTLLRPAGGTPACLGFMTHLDQPDLQITGWSCQGDTLPARRAAVGCILNRLTLLNTGNDPKLAELFARAELKRGSCAAAPASADAATWVTDSENPRLRGGL